MQLEKETTQQGDLNQQIEQLKKSAEERDRDKKATEEGLRKELEMKLEQLRSEEEKLKEAKESVEALSRLISFY